MESQPPNDDLSESQPGADQTRRGGGWVSVLGFLIVLFVVLLAAVGCWVALAGLRGAFESTGFQYLGLAVIFVGFGIATRMTARMLQNGIIVDKRNVLDLSRSQRFKR